MGVGATGAGIAVDGLIGAYLDDEGGNTKAPASPWLGRPSTTATPTPVPATSAAFIEREGPCFPDVRDGLDATFGTDGAAVLGAAFVGIDGVTSGAGGGATDTAVDGTIEEAVKVVV